MGQYCLIANPAKREYIRADDFGENIQLSCFPAGGGIHIRALALLVCHIDPLYARGSNEPIAVWGPPAGAWAGDAIIVAGDEQPELNQNGIITTTEEESQQNHYWMALREFGNISHKVLAMLCEAELKGGEYDEDDFIPTLVSKAKDYWHSKLLLTLGNAVFYQGCKSVEEELLRQWGSEWVEAYQKKLAHNTGEYYRLG